MHQKQQNMKRIISLSIALFAGLSVMAQAQKATFPD